VVLAFPGWWTLTSAVCGLVTIWPFGLVHATAARRALIGVMEPGKAPGDRWFCVK